MIECNEVKVTCKEKGTAAENIEKAVTITMKVNKNY